MMMVVIMSTTTTMRYMLMTKMVLVATNLTASLLQRALLVLVVELLHNHVDPRARSQLLRQSDDGDDNGDGDDDLQLSILCIMDIGRLMIRMVMSPLLFVHISFLDHQ